MTNISGQVGVKMKEKNSLIDDDLILFISDELFPYLRETLKLSLKIQNLFNTNWVKSLIKFNFL